MAQSRKLPNTDVGRNIALTAAKTKKDNTEPENIVLSENTQTRLDDTQPLFATKMQARGTALQLQSQTTTAKVVEQAKAKMFISHFIQGFNNGVDREVFPASHRAFYQLDVNSSSVPALDSEDLVLLWGQRLIDGDAARILAGGTAIAMPTIAQVTTQFNHFKSASIAQSTAKDAYDLAQQDVSNMRTDVDKLILRIWDEVETAFNDEPIESKRRHSREWGVVYVSTVKANITGTVTKQSDGNALKDVNVAILESGDIVQTLEDGTYKLTTDYSGTGTLEFSLTGYVTQTFPIELTEGASLVQNVAMVAM